MRKAVKLVGLVSSGRGVGKRFVNLAWARKQFAERLGLNLTPELLTSACRQHRSSRSNFSAGWGRRDTPGWSFCKARCLRALIMGKIHGAVVMPQVPNYPDDLVEVLAPVNLREALRLKDGDAVEVAIRLD